jgi:hypothetical protein
VTAEVVMVGVSYLRLADDCFFILFPFFQAWHLQFEKKNLLFL